MSAVLASIPSPPTGVYRLGPLTIHMYGLMLLLATVLLAEVWDEHRGELLAGGIVFVPISLGGVGVYVATDAMIGLAREHMKTQQLHLILNTVWAVVAEANRYFAGEAPWALAKTDPARQRTVLYVTAEVLRQVAILCQPFIPASAGKLLDILGIPAGERQFDRLGDPGKRIASETALPAPAPVFPRYVEPEAVKA